MLISPVQTAPFKEHPITDISIQEPHEFDVVAFDHASPNFIIAGKFSLQQYCSCLLTKLLSIGKSRIKPFLHYQCAQHADPLAWLNKLEKLIHLNRDLFTDAMNIIIGKTLIIIELLREEIEKNKFAPARKYDFHKLKTRLKQYPRAEDQLICLYEARTEYLQNKPKAIDPSETPFDTKIDIEIEKIERIEELKKRSSQHTPAYKSRPAENNKIMIRGHINILVDAFLSNAAREKSQWPAIPGRQRHHLSRIYCK